MRYLKWIPALMLAFLLAACAGQQWESAGEETGEAWDETKEAAGAAWEATAKTTSEAWEETKQAFIGEMSDEEEVAFENCVDETREDYGVTQEEAERGCWRKMKDEIYDDEQEDDY